VLNSSIFFYGIAWCLSKTFFQKPRVNLPGNVRVDKPESASRRQTSPPARLRESFVPKPPAAPRLPQIGSPPFRGSASRSRNRNSEPGGPHSLRRVKNHDGASENGGIPVSLHSDAAAFDKGNRAPFNPRRRERSPADALKRVVAQPRRAG
jgi:hypothetical protein